MTPKEFDVIIIGGALAGAATAVQLLREEPDLKIAIVEKSAAHGRRVGESTVETSAYFLGRVLGLTRYLNENHLTKQGMRFWFQNKNTKTIADCSEIGPAYNVRLPGYQLDRALLDEHILKMAVEQGAHLYREVKVLQVELQEGASQKITAQTKEGQPIELTSRWVVDASGFASFLSRKLGWHTPNTEHPTATVWSRFRRVGDWDGHSVATKHPVWSRRAHGVRGLATNHLTGYGWWAWWIPLKGGDVSLGVVYDQRLVQFPKGDASLGDRLLEFLRQHPCGKDLLGEAEYIGGDVHSRKNLAYSSSNYAQDGLCLVGDAAAFMDPFYSPGMDWISFTTYRATELILAWKRGTDVAGSVASYNKDFKLAYDRWFSAIYKDKYYYMGDYELMRLAFKLDLGLYYLGVVQLVFKRGKEGLALPPFSHANAGPIASLMRFYNRRLAAMAQARMRRGTWGRRNTGCYFGFNSYRFGWLLPARVFLALFEYLCLELREGWRARSVPAVSMPVEAVIPTTHPAST